MIIEGGNDALRLDVNVDRYGKPVKVGVSSVDHWITKKDNSGHKNDEGNFFIIFTGCMIDDPRISKNLSPKKNISDGYKTEDEVVFSHPTKINRNADRLISTAQVNPQ